MTSTSQLARIVNYLYGAMSDPATSPSALWVGLSTGTVSTTGVISGEVSGGGYTRVSIPNNKVSWSTATTNGSVTLKTDVTFPESTTAWGNITTVFLSDAQTGGTALYYVTLPTSRNVQAHVTVYFKGDPTGNSGDITLSVSN